ncbi:MULTISPECIES: peptidylprolyl isomerase [Olivibacter]|jgi:peptidyl-prolyl cis-trans isomerase SurA|uniref:PpiC-type peptidyl-prolyl cis-trans isomerase n=2 Tax=Sphingobacteriaceae TaxID=84566 RepID=F4C198_SPHS2|nr:MULTISPECIES: peptidylprolyl isomerase [Olivibacter]MDM8177608.1 peptidylprolyl isomerase [Olivibacter sp. 47]QEL00051.1 peptidylprolyl isomerase [Olivibacter sp. LS-1]
MKKFAGLLTLIFLACAGALRAQDVQVIDKVAAVVGGNIILQSDIEMQYAQYLSEGNRADPGVKCMILEQLLTNKLLTQQAAIDSIEVTEDEVDDNINNRLRYMTRQAGGQEQLEKFLNRSLLQYKEEMRPAVKEQLIAQKMQAKITEKTGITPLEVKRYFEKIPKDSLPNYNTEVEVGEIVVFPKLTKEEKQPFYDRAESLRMGIKAGDDFGTMARLYSQDPGSASSGGDLGFFDRSSMVKEFTSVAFRLKPGEISNVFESEYGFHFLQVLERRGEQVRARHILIGVKPNEQSMERAKKQIDSIYTQVKDNKIPFSTAAALYSGDEMTKYNGGMMLNAMNQQTRTTYIPVDQLDAADFSAIDTLKAGEYSKPFAFSDPQTKKEGYRFLYLKSRTEPHRASLEKDYAKIKELAEADKLNRVVSEWFEERRKTTYIRIDDEFNTCAELKDWVRESEINNAQAQVKE